MELTVSSGDVDFVIQQALDVPQNIIDRETKEHKKKVKKKNVGSK